MLYILIANHVCFMSSDMDKALETAFLPDTEDKVMASNLSK